MHFTKTDALNCVKNATKAIDFEKVAELSKEELEELLANTIYQMVNSIDFKRYIKEQSK